MRTFLVAFAALLALAVLAQRPDPALQQLGQDYSFVSTNDLILVGTLGDITVPEAPKDRTTIRQTTAPATVTVEKVLKGKAGATEMKLDIPLRLDYTMAMENNKPVYTINGWLPKLAKGDKVLLGFQRTQAGLILQPYGMGAQAADRAPALEKALAALPLKASLPAVIAPIAFGEKTKLSVDITNTSDKAIDLTSVGVSGFYLSKALDPQMAIQTPESNVKVDPTTRKGVTIKPGETFTAELTVNAFAPPAWKLFDPATMVQTPVALRATVQFQLVGADPKAPVWSNISSPWQIVMAGHPVPATLE